MAPGKASVEAPPPARNTPGNKASKPVEGEELKTAITKTAITRKITNASSAAQQGTVRAVVASKADPGKESVELPGKNLTRGPMVSMHAKETTKMTTKTIKKTIKRKTKAAAANASNAAN